MDNWNEVQSEDREPAALGALPGGGGDSPALSDKGGEVGLPFGVHELVLSAAKIKRLGERIRSLPRFHDDRFGTAQLAQMFLSPTTVFYELGEEDGIVVAEDVGAGGYVNVHIIVFNRRALPGLEDTLKHLISIFFQTFKPAVLAAWIPDNNPAALSLIRRLGWNFDGLLRGIMLYSGKRVDAHVFSIKADEV